MTSATSASLQGLKLDEMETKFKVFEDELQELKFTNQLLEEKIEGRMAIAEHTNIFLDIIFIILSVVLWIITMQGWRNSKEVEKERAQIKMIHDQDKKEIAQYKAGLQKDRENFEQEYDNLIHNITESMEVNRRKIEDGYKVMEEQYEQIIKDIKGVSEYYLELVAISHEPDLAERVFEYERILRNSVKYDLSEGEKGRLYYYLSITLYQLATKTPDAKGKIVYDQVRKASKYISSAITLDGKKGIYFYEKAKIELEKYKIELAKDRNFIEFTDKIYEIEEYFQVAFRNSDVEFYMFEDMVLLLNGICEKLTNTESDRRVMYDTIISWCEKAKAFDEKAYLEDSELPEIHANAFEKIKDQNAKLNS